MTGAGSVFLIGALDTKGAEYDFVRTRIRAAGAAVTMVDIGVLGTPQTTPDITRDTVAALAGADVAALVRSGDRNLAMQKMAEGAAALVRDRHASGDLAAALVLGGSNAGYVMSRVADALPFGVPKMLVSTIVSGDTTPYVGTSDLLMLYPVVDIAGLNSVSIPVLCTAADTMVGLVSAPPVPAVERTGPAIACTMFGVTTACVSAVTAEVEARGAEMQVFHATGTGGRTLEALIASRAFDIVVDITTTELADDLVGGVCSAGPDRLTAAGRTGTPQIVSTGALDMVNFGGIDTVPERFRDRALLAHNPSVTLMRTNREENAALGALMARKLNRADGFVEVHVPARGFSQISAPGGPFHDPDADEALIDALRRDLDPRIPLHVHDTSVNDPEFARHIISAVDRATHHLRKGNTHDESL